MLLRFNDGTAKNSGQRLDDVNPNYLVQASGKKVLKNFSIKFSGEVYSQLIFFMREPHQLSRQDHLLVRQSRVRGLVRSVEAIRPVVVDPRRMNAPASVAGPEVREADRARARVEVLAVR